MKWIIVFLFSFFSNFIIGQHIHINVISINNIPKKGFLILDYGKIVFTETSDIDSTFGNITKKEFKKLLKNSVDFIEPKDVRVSILINYQDSIFCDTFIKNVIGIAFSKIREIKVGNKMIKIIPVDEGFFEIIYTLLNKSKIKKAYSIKFCELKNQ